MSITKERRDALRADIEHWGTNLCDVSGTDILTLLDALDAADREALASMEEIARLRAELEAAEAKIVEPVAWRWPEPNMGGFHVVVGHQPLEHLDKWQPLYAAPPAAEPVKVKPLEWKKAFWGGKQAQTFYGRYSVGRNTWSATGFEMRDPDCGDSDTLASGEYDTEQEALDAAQALHEANICSTLISPAP